MRRNPAIFAACLIIFLVSSHIALAQETSHDLAVKGIAFTPNQILKTETVQVVVGIENRGSYDEKNVTVILEIRQIEFAHKKSIPLIRHGETPFVKFPIPVAVSELPRAVTIVARIVPVDSETNLANNQERLRLLLQERDGIITPMHKSEPMTQAHQYLAGEAARIWPGTNGLDLQSQDDWTNFFNGSHSEIWDYIGAKTTYVPIDTYGVVTYGGRDHNGQPITDTTWPSPSIGRVSYSCYNEEVYYSFDLETPGGDGSCDNLTVGGFQNGGNDIIEGTHEEDLFNAISNLGLPDNFFNGSTLDGGAESNLNGAFIFYNHFRNVDESHNGGDEDGLTSFTFTASTSAIEKAEKYWNEYVIPYYLGINDKPVNKELSYYYLGRVAHLLADMALPAHANGDAHVLDVDAYEYYMGQHYAEYTFNEIPQLDLNGDVVGRKPWAYSAGDWNYSDFNYVRTQIPGTTWDPEEPNDAVAQAKWNQKSPLYHLFWCTAEIADNYDSDGANGEVNPGRFNSDGWFADSESRLVGDNLMRQAMKSVAELYKLFWDSVNDSDADGLLGYDEIGIYGTDPDVVDTDNDGIDDGDEVAYWGNDWNANPDHDGFINLLDPDSDNDTIADGPDNCRAIFNPGQEDADADGTGDVCEPAPTEWPLVTQTANQTNPAIASDSLGNIHVVWQDYRNGNWEIYFSKYDSDGRPLVLDVRVTNTSASSTWPDVSTDSSGNSYVVWDEARAVRFCKLGPVGNKLTGDISVSGSSTSDPYPTIATTPSGISHMAYERTVVTSYRLYYSKFAADGSRIGSELSVYSDNVTGDFPKKADCGLDSSGNCYITWRDHDLWWNIGIYVRRINSNMTMQASVRRLVSDSARNPRISVTGTDQYRLIYEDMRGATSEIYLNLGVNNDRQISETVGSAYEPAIVTDSLNHSFIPWHDNRNGKYDVYLIEIGSDNATIGPDLRISHGPANSQSPDICLAGGRYKIVWQDNKNGNWDIYANFGSNLGLDSDSDGLSDSDETSVYGTLPNDDDSDNDGINDGDEVAYWGSRWNQDIDADARINLLDDDSDGDGVNDGQERTNGTDPGIPNVVNVSIIPSAETVAVGGSAEYFVRLENLTQSACTVTLDIIGLSIDPSWVSFGANPVTLIAGEARDVSMTVAVPLDCSIGYTETELVVLESAPCAGSGRTASTTVFITPDPQISDLLPTDSTKTPTTSVLVSWRTNMSAMGAVYYRAASSGEYQTVTGPDGADHSILLQGLLPDTTYYWHVESATPCGDSTSEVRQFTTGRAVAFEYPTYAFEVPIAYDQHVSVGIVNTDTLASHEVLLSVVNPYNDIAAGFVGAGSEGVPLIIAPGETRAVDLALHTPDATKTDYVLQLMLTSDPRTPAEAGDIAVANIHVRRPVVNFSLTQISSDPVTLTNTYEITNSGDALTDMTVKADDTLRGRLIFVPKIEHMTMASGQSITFKATFVPDDAVTSTDGALTATAAGHSENLSTHFGCAIGTTLYDVTLANPHYCVLADNWYCTNRPQISSALEVPAGISASNVTRAGVYIRFEPHSGALNHNVKILLNGVVVGEIRDTVPSGDYGFAVPPSAFHYATSGVAQNTIDIHTEHLSGGHYVVATSVRLYMELSQMQVSVCAASQPEAQAAAQNVPYLGGCDISDLNLCPRITNVAILDSAGQPRESFIPGENVQTAFHVLNPDLVAHQFTARVTFDDTPGDGIPIGAAQAGITVLPNSDTPLQFSWDLPVAASGERIYVQIQLNETGCGDSTGYTTSFMVDCKPDLVIVSGGSYSPNPAEVALDTVFTIRIKNIGGGASKGGQVILKSVIRYRNRNEDFAASAQSIPILPLGPGETTDIFLTRQFAHPYKALDHAQLLFEFIPLATQVSQPWEIDSDVSNNLGCYDDFIVNVNPAHYLDCAAALVGGYFSAANPRFEVLFSTTSVARDMASCLLTDGTLGTLNLPYNLSVYGVADAIQNQNFEESGRGIGRISNDFNENLVPCLADMAAQDLFFFLLGELTSSYYESIVSTGLSCYTSLEDLIYYTLRGVFLEISDSIRDAFIFGAQSPVDIEIVNSEGLITSVTDSGAISENISGSFGAKADHTKWIGASITDSYTLRIKGNAIGTAGIFIIQAGPYSVRESIMYENVNVTESSEGRIAITAGTFVPYLSMDNDGDGSEDVRIAPTKLDDVPFDGAADDDADGMNNYDEAAVTFSNPFDSDTDDDGVLDGADNCPLTSNPAQDNLDRDDFGDACDCDIDGDGYNNLSCAGDDCNDRDPNIRPSAAEICDTNDNDCDLLIDCNDPDMVCISYCRDADVDGYGNPTDDVLDCVAPPGYVDECTDCDDTNPAINPGEPETSCNCIDDDCEPATPDNGGCCPDFGIVLENGYNPVGPALHLCGALAEDLCAELNSGGSVCNRVIRYNISTGMYVTHICGLTFNNFSTDDGEGFFIRCSDEVTWWQEGCDIPCPTAIELVPGYNPIALPTCATTATAEGLCQAIRDAGGSADRVIRYRTETGMYDTHICGLQFNNFALEPGALYFVRSQTNATVLIP
ncbi:fibronectin type III domain-containing protein [Candidatus Poribacteria bacterium]|nr:fibronectin type III domain-containing protein [Candidatus Poribacteria bacterium]